MWVRWNVVKPEGQFATVNGIKVHEWELCCCNVHGQWRGLQGLW